MERLRQLRRALAGPTSTLTILALIVLSSATPALAVGPDTCPRGYAQTLVPGPVPGAKPTATPAPTFHLPAGQYLVAGDGVTTNDHPSGYLALCQKLLPPTSAQPSVGAQVFIPWWDRHSPATPYNTKTLPAGQYIVAAAGNGPSSFAVVKVVSIDAGPSTHATARPTTTHSTGSNGASYWEPRVVIGVAILAILAALTAGIAFGRGGSGGGKSN